MKLIAWISWVVSLVFGYAAYGQRVLTTYGELTVDYFALVDGGREEGAATLALIDVGGQIDFGAFAGLENATFDFNFFKVVGESPSSAFIGDSFMVSNLDSDLGNLRLFEAVFRMHSKDHTLIFDIGQIAVDTNFFVSEVSGLFTNASFGWAPAGIQSGGPAYAQASLGAFSQWQVSEKLSYLTGLYSTDIADPELLHSASHGFNWKFPDQGDFAWFNELNYTLEKQNFAVDLKLGGWVEEGLYENEFRDISYDRNTGAYFVLDRICVNDSSVKGFIRMAASPSDRNAFKSYFDFGVMGKSPLPFRKEDIWGVAYGSSHLSRSFALIDSKKGEGVVELVWKARVLERFLFQPTFQYVSNPGEAGGVPYSDAVVFGIRMQSGW